MIYFAILKSEITYGKIKKSLIERDLTILKYYPKLRVIKFKTEKEIQLSDFIEFESFEEEKNDFSV
ncbi:hypothetical protein [Polaribacter sp. L3A8]|uniref:hypothetical protein n=1 Tax=Polaribacter sp. L3A8 TaxID=2686361 RepID=UPI00131D005C|nr:hypothetical protein [Polaribacter sp. L3A8]